MPSWQSHLIDPLLRLLVGRRGLARVARAGQSPNAQRAAVRYLRRADTHTAPRTVVRAWSIQTIDVMGAPLHLHTRSGQLGDRVALYLHGGGYVHGPVSVQWALASSLVGQAGFDLAVLDYPKAPEHTADVTSAVALAAFALLSDRWGGADRVAVFGDSAGGGLAVLLTQARIRKRLAPPRCLALMSPWLDLGMSHPAIPDQVAKDVQLDRAGLISCGKLWASGRTLDDPLVSPGFGPIEGFCPVWISAGTHELFYPDCAQFAARMAAVGVEAEWHVEQAMQHAFYLLPLPERRRAHQALVAFLRRH